MFFYLGNDCNLLNKHREHLFTDLGWKQHGDIYYKGYCLDYNIDSNIDKILGGDKPQGIYCVIQNNNIFNSDIRPFPLYRKEDELTNLKLKNFVEIEHNKYQLPTTQKSFDNVVKEIIEILVENLSKVELNIWCSGGIDSTMLIALAEYAKLPYTIHIAKPRIFRDIKHYEGAVEEYTSPLIEFCRKNYWAYAFLSNFNNKVITTGFYGDEYFCRSVWQINILANRIGKLGPDVVKETDYAYNQVNRFKATLMLADINDAKRATLDTLGSSHVWHIDNTTTFCPIMDKRIVDCMWSLDENLLLDCAVNATVQKEIIKSTAPDVLSLVDKQKNTLLGRRNFFNNIEKVKLHSCTTIVVH
jgi:hypothetical protein